MIIINLEQTCKSDEDCDSEKACISSQCLDPCTLRNACGSKALCKTIVHKPRCSCPDCHVGRPDRECTPDPNCETIPKTPGDAKIATACKSDRECPENLGCDPSGQCSNPCDALKAFQCEEFKKCVVRKHRPVCVCKSGFIVNELGELTCAPDKRECQQDEECASNMACREGKCRNPCVDYGRYGPPCTENKQCEVMDHKPVCICTKDCVPAISICLRDNGCPPDLACRNYQCVNPCDTAKCAGDTPCYVQEHKPICKFCPPGFINDTYQGCLKGKHKLNIHGD